MIYKKCIIRKTKVNNINLRVVLIFPNGEIEYFKTLTLAKKEVDVRVKNPKYKELFIMVYSKPPY